ncbi:aminotransferase class V-fold PLP-dependent enzyme [Orbus sturtevantii]|uniref:aminotransferase class V-fold PLP-dependent enzyme n=1 Tax=Orbus sturtevantii TaxID=3074109 RepID=UPI00370D5BA7
MNVYPLKSLTIDEAIALQFDLVDAITQAFHGHEILTRGDLGLVPGLNQPKTTMKVEKVLAKFFASEDALLIRGSGTNAIRLALYATVGHGGTMLVHDAPIYPTTQVSINMLGIRTEKVDFNDLNAVAMKVKQNKFDGILIQVTRQKINDAYDLEELISAIREIDKNIFIITDDNYSALKTKKIGVQAGATLSCFSSFKLLGPEGIGCIVGRKKEITKLKHDNYSGGGQVQGHEAIDVIKGMIYAPVSLAISSQVSDEVCSRLNSHECPDILDAMVVNAQSKVIIVRLAEKIAKSVIAVAEIHGAITNPVGAESKYEFCPLFYRVSGTFRESDPNAENYMIRINPNRAGADTIIRILKQAIVEAKRE